MRVFLERKLYHVVGNDIHAKQTPPPSKALQLFRWGRIFWQERFEKSEASLTFTLCVPSPVWYHRDRDKDLLGRILRKAELAADMHARSMLKRSVWSRHNPTETCVAWKNIIGAPRLLVPWLRGLLELFKPDRKLYRWRRTELWKSMNKKIDSKRITTYLCIHWSGEWLRKFPTFFQTRITVFSSTEVFLDKEPICIIDRIFPFSKFFIKLLGLVYKNTRCIFTIKIYKFSVSSA